MSQAAEKIETSAVATSTVDDLKPGASARVQSLAQSNAPLFRKLHAMGVVEGNILTVLGRAPFGDPISISTLGYTLSLRRSEARQISVTPLS